MKPKDPNSETSHESIFKAANHAAAPDQAFLLQLRKQTAQAFDEAKQESRSLAEPYWRILMKNRMIKLSVAAVIGVAVVSAFVMLGGPLENTAYAHAIQKLQLARTLTYTMITANSEKPGETINTVLCFKDGKLRTTTNGGDVECIVDGETESLLTLIHPIQLYMILDYNNMPDNLGNDPFESVARLRALPAHTDDVLPAQDVNGHWAQGFRVCDSDVTTTVWIDLDDKTLVQAEVVYAQTPGMNYTLNDIQCDEPVDDALFSLEPPAGYRLQSYSADAATLAEADFIAFMRSWSKLVKDHTFPPTVNGLHLAKISAEMGQQGKFQEKWTEQDNQTFGQNMYKGLMFLTALTEDTHWRYAGADVVRDTPDMPIFWYRPTGSVTYRVLYADLSIVDVLPEDLPQ